MSSSNLYRWSGLAAIVGGALFAAVDVASFFVFFGMGTTADLGAAASTPAWGVLIAGSLLSLLLVLWGLTGMYVRQAEQAGMLGVLGFVLAFAGTLLLAGFQWTNLFVTPELARVAPDLLAGDPEGIVLLGIILSLFVGALGWLAFGIASLLAKVMPRWAAILLIVGGVVSATPVPVGAGVVLGAGLVWAGYWLWSGGGAA